MAQIGATLGGPNALQVMIKASKVVMTSGGLQSLAAAEP
jgi:hypothetical protein